MHESGLSGVKFAVRAAGQRDAQIDPLQALREESSALRGLFRPGSQNSAHQAQPHQRIEFVNRE
jgi:hypothetical protein